MEPMCSGAKQQQGLKRDLRLLALLCGPSHSAGLQKENISLQKGQEPPSSPPNLSRPALQVLLPTVVLLFLLAVAGSAGLIHALRRRRRSKEGNGTGARLGFPAQRGQGTIPALPP